MAAAADSVAAMRRNHGIALTAALLAACALPGFAAAGQNLYVGNSQGNSVSAFGITTSNGLLTPLAGSPFASGDAARGVVLTPDGTHLYVTSTSDNNVHGYVVAPSGALTPLPGSPYATGPGPQTLALNPAGTTLYVANTGASSISAFSVAADGSLGVLAGSPFATGGTPTGIAVAPDGSHVYVASFATDSIRTHQVVTTAGGLGPPLTTPAGGNVWNVRPTPDGTRLYASNLGDATLSGYAIAGDGTLTGLPGSPYPTGAAPEGIAITPDGTKLYNANVNDSTISAFSIADGGALTAIPGGPFAGGVDTAAALAVTADGRRLYAGNLGNDTVAGFNIAAGGALGAQIGSPYAGVDGPDNTSVVVSPDQGPTAAFTAKTAKNGTVKFNGSASTDPTGSIARYSWDFADGQTASSGGTTPNHQYAESGRYEATLMVTDDAGCSTERTFNGQMAMCNGGPQALATVKVKADTEVKRPQLKGKGKQEQKGGKILVKLKAGAKEDVKVKAKGKITADDREYNLKKVRKSVAGGKRKTLKLKLKKPGDASAVRRALGRAKARVTVTFTDDAGNRATKKKTVRLK